MSQSSTLTRCPHCGTRFRVTGEQLNVAGGKVRCGQCMEVFNALDHREPEPVPQPTPDPTGPEPEHPTPDQTAPATKHESSTETPEEPEEPEDDLVFEDDPEEDAAAGNYAGKKAIPDEELSDSFLAMDEDDPEHPYPEDESESGDEAIDESWAEAMLKEEDSAPSEQDEPQQAPPEPEDTTEPAPDDTPLFDSAMDEAIGWPDEHPNRDTLTMAEDDPGVTATDAMERADTPSPARPGSSHGGQWDNLRSEPIAVASKERPWLRRTLWTLVTLALIALLIAQVTWFQFDRLASVPQLRPWYEKACQYAGCDLPPLIALDRINSRKLVVRDDPDQRNALIVDAVLVNNAEFRQPFPAIGLSFSNLSGEVVAQSVFEPTEYLRGNATDLTEMPTATPVRISIAIRDPGRDAVNYNLEFLPRRATNRDAR
ncbi:hypothetical protein CF392_15290 [Tamilnaduibacter salinus]|uniref:Zinc finger/thioredoxin putative domain-containing protein n=1 Tax=Tamilnaduibacter salinus TaxID=1484056 RepID=A0A2A2I006_9GAMM|nr:DUF3426 domain-containing protein [Tamilnaduibacter salinus]PAV24614.1 hypothetical protein CF392_15290 [Tamilnaduibacter salinus]